MSVVERERVIEQWEQDHEYTFDPDDYCHLTRPYVELQHWCGAPYCYHFGVWILPSDLTCPIHEKEVCPVCMLLAEVAGFGL